MAMSDQERDFFIPLLQDAIKAGSSETLLTYKETLRGQLIPTLVLALQNSEAQDQLYARLLQLDPRLCLEILQQPTIQNILKDSLALSKEILQAAKQQSPQIYKDFLTCLAHFNPTILTTPLQGEDLHSSFLHQAILNPNAIEFNFLHQSNIWSKVPLAYRLFLQGIHPEQFKDLALTKTLTKRPPLETLAEAGDVEYYKNIITRFCAFFRAEEGLLAEFRKQHQETLELAFKNDECRTLFLNEALEEENANMLTEFSKFDPNFIQNPYRLYGTLCDYFFIRKIEFALSWLKEHQNLLNSQQKLDLDKSSKNENTYQTYETLIDCIDRDDYETIVELCSIFPENIKVALQTEKSKKALVQAFFASEMKNTKILEEFHTYEPTFVLAIITALQKHPSPSILKWVLDFCAPELPEDTLAELRQLQNKLNPESTQALFDPATDAFLFEQNQTILGDDEFGEAPIRRPSTPPHEQHLDLINNALQHSLAFYNAEPKPELVDQELKPGDHGFKGYHFDHGLNGAHLHETDALIPFWLMQFSDELEAAGCALMQIERAQEALEPEQVTAVLNGVPFLRITSYDFENNFSIPEEKAFSKALKTLLYPINQGHDHYGCLLLHFNDQNEIEICVYFEPLNYRKGIPTDINKLVEKLVDSGQFGNPEILTNPTMVYMGQEDDIYCGDYVTAILEAFAHQRISILALVQLQAKIIELEHKIKAFDQNRLNTIAEYQILLKELELKQGIDEIITTTEQPREMLINQLKESSEQLQSIFDPIQKRALSRDEIELIRSLIVLSLNPQNYEAQLHANYQPRDEAHLQENFAKIKQKLPELMQRMHTLQFKFELEPHPSKASTSPQPFLAHTELLQKFVLSPSFTQISDSEATQ